jgi:hypothetical protein
MPPLMPDAAIPFPPNPSPGVSFYFAGTHWIYSGDGWTANGRDGPPQSPWHHAPVTAGAAVFTGEISRETPAVGGALQRPRGRNAARRP